MSCHGNGKDHCCWIHGQVCEYLEEHTVPGRRWACGLRRELGSWGRVHADPRYMQSEVKKYFDASRPGYGCGDLPQNIPEIMNNPAMGKCCWGSNG